MVNRQLVRTSYAQLASRLISRAIRTNATRSVKHHLPLLFRQVITWSRGFSSPAFLDIEPRLFRMGVTVALFSCPDSFRILGRPFLLFRSHLGSMGSNPFCVVSKHLGRIVRIASFLAGYAFVRVRVIPLLKRSAAMFTAFFGHKWHGNLRVSCSDYGAQKPARKQACRAADPICAGENSTPYYTISTDGSTERVIR